METAEASLRVKIHAQMDLQRRMHSLERAARRGHNAPGGCPANEGISKAEIDCSRKQRWCKFPPKQKIGQIVNFTNWILFLLLNVR